MIEAYHLEAIVDVRRFPTSKHRHFKRQELESCLNSNGIDYHHVKELGGYRKGGYTKYMATEGFITGIYYVEALAASKRVALMCAELLFSKCHRRFIADALTLRGHTVIHIVDPSHSYEHKVRSERNRTLDEFLDG